MADSGHLMKRVRVGPPDELAVVEYVEDVYANYKRIEIYGFLDFIKSNYAHYLTFFMLKASFVGAMAFADLLIDFEDKTKLLRPKKMTFQFVKEGIDGGFDNQEPEYDETYSKIILPDYATFPFPSGSDCIW
ncbi:hypothetical protein L1987_18954 [Smallanthus sonchifolius]|uniref:Uncharacterized protein n=1 Tax=Smallanthus sonchifolius TaxID=185202 RepID=A0ACB9J264_9ASTR|nr:hypothetical protein L1987_18954 [Smallanthus sonchifolius]